MDWRAYQQDLFKKIPFVGKQLNSAGIEKFVMNTVKQIVPEVLSNQSAFDPFKTASAASLDYELFESHRSVFVRCRLSDRTLPRDLHFFASKRSLKIEYAGNSEVIALPADINPSRTTGRIRDGILEIRMPKSRRSDPFQEIFIHE